MVRFGAYRWMRELALFAGAGGGIGWLNKTGEKRKDKAGGRKEWDFPALGKGYVPFPELFAMLDKAENHCPFSSEIEFTAFRPPSPRSRRT